MVAQWKKAKQLRDRVLRLPSDNTFRRQVMESLSATAAAEEIPDDEFDVGYLLDIADFIGSLTSSTESFLLDEEQPRQPTSRPPTRHPGTTQYEENARSLAEAASQAVRDLVRPQGLGS